VAWQELACQEDIHSCKLKFSLTLEVWW
jgi:hypothetical protein